MIGAVPPAAISDSRYLAVSILAGLITFFWYPIIDRLSSPVLLFDAAGLGLFCVAGADKALAFHAGPLAAMLLGMMTGIGGGIVRDVLVMEVPTVHLINNPYKIMLAQGEWTCTVADFRGTMTGPMTMPGGTVIQPTNKSFHVDFCTVARWNEQGQIVEENLFYDLMGMLKQIGLMPGQAQKAA
jgi:uncharacterized membrane protein YeiH